MVWKKLDPSFMICFQNFELSCPTHEQQRGKYPNANVIPLPPDSDDENENEQKQTTQQIQQQIQQQRQQQQQQPPQQEQMWSKEKQPTIKCCNCKKDCSDDSDPWGIPLNQSEFSKSIHHFSYIFRSLIGKNIYEKNI